MKKILFIIFIFTFLRSRSQDRKEFDSVKIYRIPFYTTTAFAIDRHGILEYGKLLTIDQKSIVDRLLAGLLDLVKNPPKFNLDSMRQLFKTNTLPIKTLFVFYSKGKNMEIGVASTNILFIDDTLYLGNNIKYKKLIASISESLVQFIF
jgi:hypothetical protein